MPEPDRPDVVARVLAAADRHGAAPALTGPRGTLSHAALADRIRAVAHRLRAAGLATGDRMLFSVRPGPDAVVLALGTVAAGGTVVFADPGVGGALFAARVAQAAPRWAAAESLLHAVSAPGPLRALARRRGVLLPAYAALPVRHVRTGPWLPGVPRGALALARLARPVRDPAPVPADPDADAVVVPTGGTTAAPKAVVHTRGSLGAALDVLGTRLALGPGDRVHTDQLLMGLPALAAGAHWSLPPPGTGPAARPEVLARGLRDATHTFLVPADLAVLLDAVERGAVAPTALRTVLVGAAPVLPPLLRRAAALLPATEVLAVYGMTEILPVAVATGPEKLAHPGPGDLVGVPLPGVAARVDAAGVLRVGGPHLARGYLAGPALTEHDTGDLARIGPDGRIVLEGRATDMIIRGRVNIYPGLHEPALAALPGVAQAVLVGLPDPIGDERVVLAVVAAPGAPPDLARRVRAALPGLVDAAALPDDVVVVTDVPVTGRSRKPDRAALRARLAARDA